MPKYRRVLEGTISLDDPTQSPLAILAMNDELRQAVLGQFEPEDAGRAAAFSESYYQAVKVDQLGPDDVEQTLLAALSSGLKLEGYLLTIGAITCWWARKQIGSGLPLPQTKRGFKGLKQISSDYLAALESLGVEIAPINEGLSPTGNQKNESAQEEKCPNTQPLIQKAAEIGIPVCSLEVQPWNIKQLAMPITNLIRADNEARQRLLDNPPEGSNLIVNGEGRVLKKPPKIPLGATTQEIEVSSDVQIRVVPTGGRKRKKAIGTYKELKNLRRKQAQWRAQYRQRTERGTTNLNSLPRKLVRQAATIKALLKERGVSYGDRVFNFALLEEGETISPVEIPALFPFLIWQTASQLEAEKVNGLPMVRVDAIRKPDNSIAIIELNPCWVDNIAALAAFCEVYGIESTAIEVFGTKLCQEAKSKLDRELGNNLGLVYCNQATGCKRDEIYCLKAYLESAGMFGEIKAAPLREIQLGIDGRIYIKDTPLSILYLNGSFSMAQEFITEQKAVDFIRKSQAARKLALAPAQFRALDQKECLCQFPEEALSFIMPTSTSITGLEFPLIAKPLRAESLRGIQIINAPEELRALGKEKYIFQEFRPVSRSGIVCFNAESNTIFKPDRVFEKINIWIIDNQIVGAIATYFPTPLISDAGYNLPITWETI